MTALTHNQKRLSPWTILWVVVALVIILALTPVLLFWIWNANQAKVVAQLEANIRAGDEPVTGDELARFFPLEPGQEDVRKLWIEGMTAIFSSENEAARATLPFVGDDNAKELPKLHEPWPKLTACQDFLNHNRLALEKLHEAARRGGHAKLTTDYSKGLLAPMDDIRGSIRAAQILQMEIEVKSRLGDIRGAAQSIKTLLTLPRFFDHEPSFIGFLLRRTVNGIVTRALPDKLNSLPFTNDELGEFQQLLRSNEPDKCLRMALVGERAIGNTVLRNPEQLAEYSEQRPGFAPLNGDKASYLMLMNDLIGAIDQDFPDCFDAYARVEQDYVRKSRTWAGQWTMAYTVLLMPQVYQYQTFAAQDMVRLRVLDTAIAIEFYRRETGSLPDSLEVLVPKYLSAIPVDAFTAKPLTYEKLENAFQFPIQGTKSANRNSILNVSAETIIFPISPNTDPRTQNPPPKAPQ